MQVTDEETTNEMTERTKGAIALMPAGNREGSWWFYILQTGGVVKRNKADKLPMPDEVISILNTIALSEKIMRIKQINSISVISLHLRTQGRWDHKRLTTKIPNLKLEIFVCHCFHVKPDRCRRQAERKGRA